MKKFKKSGMAFTVDVLLYLVIVFVLIAGGMRYLNMNLLSSYRASIMMQQAESIDRALLKYGQMHRGLDKDSVQFKIREGNKGTFLADRPPVYPATANDFKNLRNYPSGYIAPNIVINGDTKLIDQLEAQGKSDSKGDEYGVYYYIPYNSKGSRISSSDSTGKEEGAYAFDLYVDLPDGTRYYTQNSKNRANRGQQTR